MAVGVWMSVCFMVMTRLLTDVLMRQAAVRTLIVQGSLMLVSFTWMIFLMYRLLCCMAQYISPLKTKGVVLLWMCLLFGGTLFFSIGSGGSVAGFSPDLEVMTTSRLLSLGLSALAISLLFFLPLRGQKQA